MSLPADFKLHAVAFREGEWWIVQFLEYGLCTAQKRLEDLPAEIRRFLKVQIQGSLALGIEPFANLLPAPQRFWKMFEEAGASKEIPLDLEASASIEVETRIAA